MKVNDLIRYENQIFSIIEFLPNGNIGAMRLSDEERHVLIPNEVVLVQSYQKQRKSLKTNLYEFFDWMFSDRCDKWIAKKFFLFIKFAFLFCAAVTLSLPLILLFEWL
jgi:hypothetical protein